MWDDKTIEVSCDEHCWRGTNECPHCKVICDNMIPAQIENVNRFKLLWIDIETTGLNATRDEILEVVVIESDWKTPCICKKMHKYVVYNDCQNFNEWALNAHTPSGLIDECKKSTISISDVDKLLCGVIPHALDSDGKLVNEYVVAGSTIGFDIVFIQNHLPLFYDNIMYRSHGQRDNAMGAGGGACRQLDVSGIKLFCMMLGMKEIKKNYAHRAQDDIFESMQNLDKCISWL